MLITNYVRPKGDLSGYLQGWLTLSLHVGLDLQCVSSLLLIIPFRALRHVSSSWVAVCCSIITYALVEKFLDPLRRMTTLVRTDRTHQRSYGAGLHPRLVRGILGEYTLATETSRSLTEVILYGPCHGQDSFFMEKTPPHFCAMSLHFALRSYISPGPSDSYLADDRHSTNSSL